MTRMNKLVLGNRGLRYKLLIAFSLMSVIPLLACTYVISNFLFPQVENLFMVSSIVVVSLAIAMLGLIFGRSLVDPVIDMALEAKIIASGEYDRNIEVSSDDEIGNLAGSINTMTQRIKSNLDELKGYSQRMREINVDIHKKVMALSSLLQIGDIISSHSIQLDPLMSLAVERAASVMDTGYGVLYTVAKEGPGVFKASVSCNLDSEKLTELAIKKGGYGVIDKVVDTRSILIIDKSAKPSKELDQLKTSYNLKNFLAIPIFSGKSDFGVLLIGSRLDDFRFKDDDVELMKVFAKQITIAIESDVLSKKTEQLAIKDDLTDLYNKTFIMGRLEEEIKRAIFYQRPCSFIALSVDNFGKFREERGDIASEEAIRQVARIIKDCAGPVGCAARTAGHDFGMLLPEKNKREASNIAEEARKKIAAIGSAKDGVTGLTVSVGVSENPIDGAAGEDIFKKAAEGVERAKKPGGNRVVS